MFSLVLMNFCLCRCKHMYLALCKTLKSSMQFIHHSSLWRHNRFMLKQTGFMSPLNRFTPHNLLCTACQCWTRSYLVTTVRRNTWKSTFWYLPEACSTYSTWYCILATFVEQDQIWTLLDVEVLEKIHFSTWTTEACSTWYCVLSTFQDSTWNLYLFFK